MALPRIAIIDYGAGNLRSVAKAFEKLGFPPSVTTDPKVVAAADAVVLPGVGAAGDTMNNLAARGMVETIGNVIATGKPFFGVCLGLQLLFETSDEGGVDCMGLLQGKVRHLGGAVKVPHIGWNQVRLARAHPLFEGVDSVPYFYFVHSYYADPADKLLVAGTTEYGTSFCSFVAKGNLVATQFHPEKSGALGLQLYDNFVRRIVGVNVSHRDIWRQIERSGHGQITEEGH